MKPKEEILHDIAAAAKHCFALSGFCIKPPPMPSLSLSFVPGDHRLELEKQGEFSKAWMIGCINSQPTIFSC